MRTPLIKGSGSELKGYVEIHEDGHQARNICLAKTAEADEVLKRLNDYHGNERITDKNGKTTEIKLSWCIDDVLQCAKDHGLKITKSQASDVLDYCLHKHDANNGVNWEVIAYWIDVVLEG